MKINSVVKCVTVILCVLALVFSFPTGAFAAPEPFEGDEFVAVAQNSQLELYVKPSTTEFMVKNKLDGSEWFSCIQDVENDPYAGGVYVTEMQSLLSLKYYDESGVMNTLNSYSSSVINDDFVLEALDNGYRVTYNFEDGIVEIPLEVTLSEDGLSVHVFTSEMKVPDEYSISELSVLPFFATSSGEKNGYLLIPDGCGGLISFDEDKTGIDEYSRRVYGVDITNSDTLLSELDDTAPISLPVFGIKRGSSAMLCVIDDGDSMAFINAYGAANVSAQSNAYASFALYSNMEYTFSAESTMIFEDGNIKLSDISEKYYFLSGESADYNGMAAKLRGLLIESGALSEKDISPSPYITLYGGITVKRSVLGILVDSVLPLTTTGQVKEIVDFAKEQGIENPVVNYELWNTYELAGKSATAFKINRKLQRDGVSFKELMKSEDFTFVPVISDVFTYTKAENIVSKFTSPATDISGTALFKKKLSETTHQEYGKRNFFLNKKYITRNLDKLIASASKTESEYIGLSDVSSMLYEDFSKNSMKRYQMKDIVTEKLAKLSKDKKLVLDNPNYYAYEYANSLVNIPMKTGGHLLIDKEVPFLQMVLGGCLEYASQPLNGVSSEEIVPKLLETGSMPHFFMYYAEEATVKNTEYSHLGAGDYKKNLKALSDIYAELFAIWEKTDNSRIIRHSEPADDVKAVYYENGAVVYINYSSESFITPNGTAVAAGEYLTEVAKQ